MRLHDSKILILAFLLVTGATAPAQTRNLMGVGISYGTVNSFSASLYYQVNPHRFHLGGSLRMSDKRGKRLDDPSGHGAALEGAGSYFWTVDAAYGYAFREKFPVNLILSAGRRISYTNYLDSGFTDGGFHTIDRKSPGIGIGVDAGINFRGLFEVYAGLHTLRIFYFGIR